METILEHQRKLMLQLSVLLQADPLAITRNRLLKMLALNIFIIEHNLEKGNYLKRFVKYYKILNKQTVKYFRHPTLSCI